MKFEFDYLPPLFQALCIPILIVGMILACVIVPMKYCKRVGLFNEDEPERTGGGKSGL